LQDGDCDGVIDAAAVLNSPRSAAVEAAAASAAAVSAAGAPSLAGAAATTPGSDMPRLCRVTVDSNDTTLRPPPLQRTIIPGVLPALWRSSGAAAANDSPAPSPALCAAPHSPEQAAKGPGKYRVLRSMLAGALLMLLVVVAAGVALAVILLRVVR
jgi:hypothetical protein